MEEAWVRITEFPDYQVSDLGRVMKIANGRIMKESCTRDGTSKIGLVCGGVQYTRAVRVLVAEAFVDGRDDRFNTPINMDGDPRNNKADNLVWRPRHFAWKYHNQFHEFTPGQHSGPIRDVKSKREYEDMFAAAISNGLLVYDVWRSVHFQERTFPTWQIFAFSK